MSKKKCTECNDTGWYDVYNAYHPEDVQRVDCEYCLPKKETVHKLSLN
jgi:hypothetical protein